MPNDTVKRRKLAWEDVNSYIQDVLLLLLQAVNTEQKPFLQVLPSSQTNNIMKIEPLLDNKIPEGSHTLNHAIKAYAQYHSTEKKSDIQNTLQLISIYCLSEK